MIEWLNDVNFSLSFAENVPVFTEKGNTAHAGTTCTWPPDTYCPHVPDVSV